MAAIQDRYPDDFAHCYGCGRLNAHGLHVRSEWTGDAAVARFTPAPFHIAMPGFVYGGLLASLIDCHAMGTAAAAWMRERGATPGIDETPRFVTAALRADYLRPTPVGNELHLEGRATAIGERKVTVQVILSANGSDCVRAEVVAVSLPPSMRPTA